ncbi:MAG: hypothetical protein DRJ10_04985 [Bacteroidetes bacterium]|nr:MAG: hypothetical protein DRJ10_04985 [Bacteroidota bacterium]
MFKNVKVLILIIALLLSSNSFGQKITSKKQSFRITTGKIEISIISPKTRAFKTGDKNNDYPVINSKYTEVILDAKGGVGRKKVKINGVEVTQNPEGQYYTTVTLFTGENIIKILAEDSKGNKSSERIKVICTYQYDIEVKKGKYYALIIGINDYEDESVPDLDGPVEDAKKLKDLLIKHYTFNEDYILMLKNPKRKELIDGFEKVTDLLTKEDNLLIFYAGHGLWDEKREIGYWLPSDASTFDTDNWFRNSTVKDFISSIHSKHTLLITDACFSGSIFKTRSGSGTGVSAYNKLYELQSRKGMTSGTLKEVPDKSVFIEYLLKRLEQNKDKYLPAAKLFNSMRDAVLNNSPNVPQYGTIQGAGDEGGEFIFIKR